MNVKFWLLLVLFLIINAAGWAVFLAQQHSAVMRQAATAIPKPLPKQSSAPGSEGASKPVAVAPSRSQQTGNQDAVSEEKKDTTRQNFHLTFFSALADFDNSVVRVHFNKKFKAQNLAALVSCTPAATFAVAVEDDYDWDGRKGQLLLCGDFVPGEKYRFSFNKELEAIDGTCLGEEKSFSLLIPPRQPTLRIGVEGRYIPPGGDYLIPVQTVNMSQVKARVVRVPAQNIVQFAVKDSRVYPWENGDSIAAELGTDERTRTFSLQLPKDKPGTTLLDLRDCLPEARCGVFLLSLQGTASQGLPKGRHYEDSDLLKSDRLFCLSDIGLSAQHSGNTLLVWATSLSQGMPLPGVQLKLYRSNNVIASTTTTDAHGLARLSFPEQDKSRTTEAPPFLLVASTADESDSTFLPIHEQTLVQTINKNERTYLARGECEAFVFTNSGIYRHGDPIHAQVLLRDDSGHAPEPFPLTLEICKPNGDVFKTISLMPDAQGAAISEKALVIPDTQPSGQWMLKVSTAGKNRPLGMRHFIVETFVPPQIRVAVKSLPENVEVGNTIGFTVGSEFFFGRPAFGLTAEATAVFADAPFVPKGWEGYSFGRYGVEKSVNQTRYFPSKKLNANGEAKFELNLQDGRTNLGEPSTAVKVTIEGTVIEPGGRPVSTRGSTVYPPFPFYIGLRREATPFAPSGRAAIFHIAAVRPDGTRYAVPVAAKAVLNRLSTIHNYRKERHRYEWTVETVRQPVSTQEIQLPVGTDVPISLHVPSDGHYELLVTHATSRAGSSLVFYAAKDTASLAAVRADSADSPLEIFFEKDSAMPGETLQATVKSPVTGTALVTMRNAQYERAFTLPVTVGKTETFPIEITDALYPGVDVSVVVVRPAKPITALAAWRAHRFFATRTLSVFRPQAGLSVSVNAGARIVDGGSIVDARVAVKDARDKSPVDGFVTLLLMDEGVLTLTNEPLPSPDAFFAASRYMPVNVHDMFNRLFPALREVPAVLSTDAIAGGGGESAVLRRLSPPVPTRRFKPLSFWSPRIPVKDGVAQASFSLPEFSGEVRLTAVAWTASASGSAKQQAKIKPHIVAKADAPRFLAPGDQASLSLSIYNESGGDAEITVHAKADGAGTFAEGQGTVSQFLLAAGASKTLRPRLVAKLSSTDNHVIVSFTVAGAGEKHVETVEIPVRLPVAWETHAAFGTLQPGEEKTFSLQDSSLNMLAMRKVRLSANPGVELAPALRYLTQYPYGCLEQTVSSVFPLVFAYGEVAAVLAGDADFKNLSTGFVEAALERLKTMQSHGCFSVWPEGGEVRPSLASNEYALYAMHFMAEAKRVGFKFASGLHIMRDYFNREVFESRSSSLRDRAHFCHVLASLGTPDTNAMFRLMYEVDKLDVCSLAHFARALALASNVPHATAVMEKIKTPATVEELSLSVLAMLEIQPDAPQVLEWLARLASLRDAQSGHWQTTWENAHALMAFAAYSRRTTTPASSISFEIKGPNGFTRTGVAIPKAVAQVKGGGQIFLKNTGASVIYFSVETTAIPHDSAGTLENGLRVSRQFHDLDGKLLDASSLKVGQTIIVGLGLERLGTMEALSDLVIQELLPACLEVQPGALFQNAPWISSSSWVTNMEVRDDRVLVFGSLSKERENRVFYRANVVSSGEFALPAPVAEAMYRPEFRARGASGTLKIME